MTVRFTRTKVLYLLHEDAALFERLCEAELLPRDVDEFEPHHAETARIVGTLVHDLDVNWSGVEVALALRRELANTRRQVRDLIALLHELGPEQR
jgi:hypothetical protein